MEPINQALQQRVWQRVQSPSSGSPQPSLPTPDGLLLDELTDLAQFRTLGNDGPPALLAQQAQERAEVLQGICRLSRIPLPERIPKVTPSDNREAALTRCMSRLLRRERTYDQLRSHGEFGLLYGLLAERCGDSAFLLSKYIGAALLHNRKR